jgi:hypothetical protein
MFVCWFICLFVCFDQTTGRASRRGYAGAISVFNQSHLFHDEVANLSYCTEYRTVDPIPCPCTLPVLRSAVTYLRKVFLDLAEDEITSVHPSFDIHLTVTGIVTIPPVIVEI